MRFDDWGAFVAEQRRSGLLQRISEFVTVERQRALTPRSDGKATPWATEGPPVYPPSEDVFNFTLTPLRQVKVVILGQDPYHQPGQAHGLAFSVRAGTSLPPSLRNIFKELCSNLGPESTGTTPDLTPWTQQGVLLLNTALTVRHGEPGSHLDAWQPFTDEVVEAVVDSADVNPHFVLWGKHARDSFTRNVGKLRSSDSVPDVLQCFRRRSDGAAHFVTATYSPHPSPLSADRGFFGSRPFSRANLALELNNPGRDCQVDWRLP